MAKEKNPETIAAETEKKKIADEKKALKQEQKRQRKEVKRRAKELSKKEDELLEEGEGSGLATFGVTLLIVVLWLAVICVVIKLDIGGFGSSVLKPVLKDVPIVNRILPGNSITQTSNPERYGGYTNLGDAVEQIKALELELDRIKTASDSKSEEIETLKAEVLRLQEFEKKQVEFQRIRTEFYEEVVYAEKGPGAEEYQKYYEAMDPATAEYIYKQVIIQLQESTEIQEYANAYSEMKPKKAAKIFEEMTNNLELVSRILNAMSAESRGSILAEMDPAIAARITKIMDPET